MWKWLACVAFLGCANDPDSVDSDLAADAAAVCSANHDLLVLNLPGLETARDGARSDGNVVTVWHPVSIGWIELGFDTDVLSAPTLRMDDHACADAARFFTADGTELPIELTATPRVHDRALELALANITVHAPEGEITLPALHLLDPL